MSLRRLCLFTTMTAAVAALGVSPTFADPAVVFNYGRGNSTCSASGFGGDYVGGASTVVVKGGRLVLLQCAAVLVAGEPVTRTQVVRSGNCTAVFTPSGHMNFTCRG